MYSTIFSLNEDKKFKYGSNVIYLDKIWKINSISNTDNLFLKSIHNNDVIQANKNDVKLIPHNKDELIKYKNEYYIITDIINKYGDIYYNLNYIKNKNSEKYKIQIKCSDKNIINIDIKKQPKIITFLKFIDRYNTTISFLNKKRTDYCLTNIEYITYNEIDFYMDNLLETCKLNISTLNKIENTLKKTQCINLCLDNLYKNPFDFITQEYQLLTYDKANKICIEYYLSVDFKVKLEKWCYDLFFRVKKEFYIPRWIFKKDIIKFCQLEGFNYNNYSEYIDEIFIEKKISKIKNKFGKDEIFITTEYLLNKERKITDMAIDLFDNGDKEYSYEFDKDELNEIIQEYENDNKFKLEPEQKESVINSICNKLSIITGPPGTGKTAITKCVNFVLYKLSKKYVDLDNNLNYIDNYANESNNEDYEQYCDIYDSDYEYDNPNIDFDKCKYINPIMTSILAPTGLAYMNMIKSFNDLYPYMHDSILIKFYNNNISGTCHRILYHTIPNIKKHRIKCTCPEECRFKFDIKLFIIDEVSMLDTFIFENILEACKYFDSRLILLGDINQLPSVGPGQILCQLINSNIFEVNKLKKIRRQTGNLVENITKINTQIITKKDFIDDSMILFDIKDFYTNKKEINEFNLKSLFEKYKLDSTNTKIITNFNKDKFIFNTNKLNILLQNTFNPINTLNEFYVIKSNKKYDDSYTFRLKDNIIRTENDYSNSNMRANGEPARIISFDGIYVTIEYMMLGNSDRSIISIDDLYENFALNYCVTVHKSQGSQYENVIYIVEPNCQGFIEKKSVYTAISRAQKRCIVIADENEFINIQSNNSNKVTLFMEESNKYDL